MTHVSYFDTIKGMTTKHIQWYEMVTRGDSKRQVSAMAGISDATLGRQLKVGELSSDLIIKIAEAYDESPVIALVDLGFISSRWITEPGVRTALSRASDEELTDELLRRLRLIEDIPVDELSARRRAHRTTPDVERDPYADGNVPDWDDAWAHAADSSTDEQAEREKRGEDLID